MSTRKDIAEVIGYMKLAFPNYSPDVTSPINTLDVLSDLLGDIPTEILRSSGQGGLRRSGAGICACSRRDPRGGA